MNIVPSHPHRNGNLKDIPECFHPVYQWANPEFREYDFGSMLIQEYKHRAYHIYILRLNIHKAASISISYDPKIVLQFMLNGNEKGYIPYLPEQGTCRLSSLQQEIHEIKCEPGKLEWMQIQWEHSRTNEMTEDFTGDLELLSEELHGNSCALPCMELAIDNHFHTLLDRIKRCDQQGCMLRLEFKACIAQLIINYLNGAGEKKGINILADINKKEKLSAVVNDIKLAPNIHRQTPYYSRKFKISGKYIKESFTLVYETTLFRYIEAECMKSAKNMLQMTKSTIDEIAMEFGYTTKGNFSRAYKKYFGHTPGSDRNNKTTIV